MNPSTPPSYTPPDKGTGLPETIDSARRWQTRLNKYVAAGLCHACAAQAAYGHQLGWANVHPPCAHCWQIVTSLGNPTGSPSGWHALDEATVPPSSALSEQVA